MKVLGKVKLSLSEVFLLLNWVNLQRSNNLIFFFIFSFSHGRKWKFMIIWKWNDFESRILLLWTVKYMLAFVGVAWKAETEMKCILVLKVLCFRYICGCCLLDRDIKILCCWWTRITPINFCLKKSVIYLRIVSGEKWLL